MPGPEFSKRDKKEIHLENIAIDLARLEDEKLIIGEVKKSSTFLESAKKQLCYYLYFLGDYGIDAEGELLFPKEKRKEKVVLTDGLLRELESDIEERKEIVAKDVPQPAVKIGYCKNCAYREFC